jgi:hypothetical protein
MTEFLQVAAPVMALVSLVLIVTGIIPSLRQTKAMHFLCGESSFVTAIAYGALAVLGVSSFAPFGAAIWFVTGSVEFAHATWLAPN